MNTEDENQDTPQFTYDPFPEPQTIPSGWDTSVFFSTSESAPTEQTNDLAESKPN